MVAPRLIKRDPSTLRLRAGGFVGLIGLINYAGLINIIELLKVGAPAEYGLHVGSESAAIGVEQRKLTLQDPNTLNYVLRGGGSIEWRCTLNRSDGHPIPAPSGHELDVDIESAAIGVQQFLLLNDQFV